MGETPDDIRHLVERARHRLGENLNDLEYSVKSQLDWRVQFHRHPLAFLGAAFGVGALLGIVSAGSRA
jgi:hypothetical protein